VGSDVGTRRAAKAHSSEYHAKETERARQIEKDHGVTRREPLLDRSRRMTGRPIRAAISLVKVDLPEPPDPMTSTRRICFSSTIS